MIGIAIVTLATAPPDYERVAPYVWRPDCCGPTTRACAAPGINN